MCSMMRSKFNAVTCSHNAMLCWTLALAFLNFLPCSIICTIQQSVLPIWKDRYGAEVRDADEDTESHNNRIILPGNQACNQHIYRITINIPVRSLVDNRFIHQRYSCHAALLAVCLNDLVLWYRQALQLSDNSRQGFPVWEDNAGKNFSFVSVNENTRKGMIVQGSSTHLLRGTQENLPYCKSSPITIGDF